MSIVVRPARPDDIDWIISQLERFSGLYGHKRALFGDEAYAREGLRRLVETHFVRIASRKEVRLGFIAGIVAPHLFNPSIRNLTELFWWVAEEHRFTAAGLLLLDEFVTWGKENCDWINFNVTEQTAIDPDHLIKRGFKQYERSFLMEA